MAVALDPTELIEDARCYSYCIPNGLMPYVVLASLLDVANGDPVPTDTNELIDEARCLESCIPPGMVWASMIVAIQGISGGGANPPPPPPSTSWRQIYDNAGDPNGIVVPEFAGPCICLDTASPGDIWWNTSGVLNPNAWY